MSSPIDSKFDEPEDSPGFLLWRVSMLWERRMRAALKPLDLTHMQFVLLAGASWLGRSDAPVSQVQIAEHAGVDVVMTSQVLRTLEAKGLVARTRHPKDARTNCIEVTSAGTKLVRRAITVVEREDAAFFAQGSALHKPLLAALRVLAVDTED